MREFISSIITNSDTLTGHTFGSDDAFVWISGGQSNEQSNNGQAASIEATYQGVQNGNVFFGGAGSSADWEKMEIGVNHRNQSSGVPNDANWSPVFLKEMDDYIASLDGGVPGQTYLLQWPQGGSRLRITDAANDWNADSSELVPGTDLSKREYLFQLANGVCGNGFNEFPAGKNIRIMGFTWRHGEADSNFVSGQDDEDWNPAAYNPDEATVLAAVKAQYKADLIDMVNAFTNWLATIRYEAKSISISEMRFLISRMNPNAINVINRPYYSAINDAFTELASGEMIAGTSLIGCDVMDSNYNFVAGDGVHDLYQAQTQMGIDRFNYFKNYIV